MDVVELSCEVSRSQGEVTWWKGDEQLVENERIEFVKESCWRRLVILKALYSDEAEYSCKCEADETKMELTVGGKTFYNL